MHNQRNTLAKKMCYIHQPIHDIHQAIYQVLRASIPSGFKAKLQGVGKKGEGSMGKPDHLMLGKSQHLQ